MNAHNHPEYFTIFRTHDARWIFEEMAKGRLRQGWGAPGFGLVSESGDPVDKHRWEKTYKQVWKEDPSPRRFSILRGMLDLDNGDIVVVPKKPKWNQFTIARVSGKYFFDVDTRRGDFGHIVPIDPASIRTFNYQADNEAFLVSSTFARASHRAAISYCYNTDQIGAACQLLKRQQGSETAKPIEEMFRSAVNEALKAAALKLQELVKNWNGLRFQEAVKHAFQNQGYKIKWSRRFDGKGGDIDLLVTPPPSPHELFSPSEIAVQVKWKQGKDENEEEAVEQVIQWAKSQNSTAKKHVISSASQFTEEAHKKAAEYDVVLIGGLQTMCFLLGVTDQYREDWG